MEADEQRLNPPHSGECVADTDLDPTSMDPFSKESDLYVSNGHGTLAPTSKGRMPDVDPVS